MKRRKIGIISGFALLLVLIVIGVSWYGYHHFGTLSTKQISANINSELIHTRQKQQAPLTKTYRQKLNSGHYTPDNMYVKLNPYKTSPLSALVAFKTKQASQVSIAVQGKSDRTTIKTTYSGYKTKHKLSILGLYPDYNNTVTLTIKAKNGQVTHKTLHIKTAKLPRALAKVKINVKTANKKKMAIGNDKLTFFVRTTKQPFGVDADGNIRWYSTNYSQHVFKELKNGHLLYLAKKNNQAEIYNELLETDFTGRIYKEYHFSNKTKSSNDTSGKGETTIVHHDTIELPNRDLLLTVSDGGGKYIEDTMVQISHKTGKVNKVIDLKKILPVKMWRQYDSTKRSDGKIDWFHQNSIYYDKSDDSLVISGRHQDLVMKLDYQTNQIKWLFSGKQKTDWPRKYRSKILKTKGDTTYPGGQHAAILLPTASANHKNLILFNNNIAITNGPEATSKQYSEGVQYQLNEKDKTIKQTWAYGKTLGKQNFSPIIGSSRYLNTNNRLLCFGFLKSGNKSRIIEVDKTTNQPVFDVELTNLPNKGYVYRSERFSLYPQNHNNQTYE